MYKFFNNQEIIYIGKAKDLKKRVSSYFGKSYKDKKTSQIKLLTDKIETFTTQNEVEALLLEQMLIKENKLLSYKLYVQELFLEIISLSIDFRIYTYFN